MFVTYLCLQTHELDQCGSSGSNATDTVYHTDLYSEWTRPESTVRCLWSCEHRSRLTSLEATICLALRMQLGCSAFTASMNSMLSHVTSCKVSWSSRTHAFLPVRTALGYDCQTKSLVNRFFVMGRMMMYYGASSIIVVKTAGRGRKALTIPNLVTPLAAVYRLKPSPQYLQICVALSLDDICDCHPEILLLKRQSA